MLGFSTLDCSAKPSVGLDNRSRIKKFNCVSCSGITLQMPACRSAGRQCTNVFTVQKENERMLKIKSILPVLAVVMIFGLSNAAFAQLSCNVASTPVSRATDTGLTEPAGDLIFNCTFGGVATTAATMTIDYGVPITNTAAYPAGKPISTVTTIGAPPTVDSVANATGQVVVS